MTNPARHESEVDTVAPLGVPAVFSAAIVLFAPLMVIDQVSGWVCDYGAMTSVALALYIACALRLLWWGVGVRRTTVHRGHGR